MWLIATLHDGKTLRDPLVITILVVYVRGRTVYSLYIHRIQIINNTRSTDKKKFLKKMYFIIFLNFHNIPFFIYVYVQRSVRLYKS